MANARALDDEIEVAEFLKKLVAALGMRVRAGPLCGRERGAPEKNGISGAVILYESHAAIHTYSQLRGHSWISSRAFPLERRTVPPHQ